MLGLNIAHIYIKLFISASWCLTLDPYPTVNVTRYNSQSFNCSVDPNWSLAHYYHGGTNIALFKASDGKCKDFVDQSSGRYTTYCDDSTRTFYLTINNVTDDYNGYFIQCIVSYSVEPITYKYTVINVQCK